MHELCIVSVCRYVSPTTSLIPSFLPYLLLQCFKKLPSQSLFLHPTFHCSSPGPLGCASFPAATSCPSEDKPGYGCNWHLVHTRFISICASLLLGSLCFVVVLIFNVCLAIGLENPAGTIFSHLRNILIYTEGCIK